MRKETTYFLAAGWGIPVQIGIEYTRLFGLASKVEAGAMPFLEISYYVLKKPPIFGVVT
jgi:hypothetical protein